MQLCHEHRGGYPFAGHIAKHKIEISVAIRNNVNVVAADEPGGFVAVVEMPSIDAKVANRQQTPLDFSGKIQIILKSLPLVGVQMVQTKTLQRVCDKALGLHSVMADFTYTVSSRFESFERRIDFMQQGRQLRIRTSRRNC